MDFLATVKQGERTYSMETPLSTVYFNYAHDRYFIWTRDGHKEEYSQGEAEKKYAELVQQGFTPRAQFLQA